MTGTSAGIKPVCANFAEPMAITCSAKCRKSSRNCDVKCCEKTRAMSPCLLVSEPFRGLSPNQDFDRAFDQPPRVFDPEIAAVDLGHRREIENLITLRRAAAIGYGHVERDLAAPAFDRQGSIDAQHVSVFASFDARALKMHLRVFGDIQKILRAK